MSWTDSPRNPGEPRPAPPPQAPASGPCATRTPVAQLRKGDKISRGIYLVETANFKQTRNNKFFIQLSLRDRTGSIKAILWEATQELFDSFSTEDFLRIDGRVEEFQQNLQIVVDGLQPVADDSVDFEEFLPVSARNPSDMARELEATIASMSDPHLKALMLAFWEDPEIRRGILRCPAGKVLHHACIGGLLEHILSLMGAAKLIARNYPRLNADMLLAAAFFHDIGKIRELSYSRAFNYTDVGQLVGHMGIGLVMLEEKAKLLPGLPREVLLHLEHIVASHHGLPEHGAMKPPMTPEAIAFHYLDNLDAKLAMVESLARELEVQGDAASEERRWTDFKPALGRRIFFPGP
jgi:3'-5' exoribonuclease